MSLDVRTIVVLLLLLPLLMSATLALDLRSGESPGLRRWNIGLGVLALSWFLIMLRGLVSPIVTVAAADALLLAGLSSQYGALLEFAGRRVPRWLVPVPAAALFAVLASVVDDYVAVTLIASLACSLALIGLGAASARLFELAGPLRWLSSGVLIAAAVAVMARAVDVAMHPGHSPEMFTDHLLHGLAFSLLLAVIVSTSFTFLVMQRRRAEARIKQLASYDVLTDALNRRAFMDLAERDVQLARRAGQPIALLMMDLDHFKRINDTCGHQMGDRVLIDFAARVRGCLRATDVLGRYGGEEFCVLLPGAPLAAAQAVAERIRAAVAAEGMADDAIAITVSVGLTGRIPQGADGLETLIAEADKALYAAKQAGRNRVVSAEPGDAATLRAAA